MSGPCPCHDDMNSAIAGHRSVVDAALRARQLAPGSSGYDDALSDGLLALWQALERYEPSRMELGSYLDMKVRSRIIDGLRTRTGVSGAGLTRHLKSPTVLPDEQELPRLDGVAEQAEMKATVDRLLIQAAALDPLLPRILTLLRQGYRRSEIAVQLGTSHTTITRRLKLLATYGSSESEDECA